MGTCNPIVQTITVQNPCICMMCVAIVPLYTPKLRHNAATVLHSTTVVHAFMHAFIVTNSGI